MFIELIDILRCTASHPDTPLVAAILERRDRDVVSGILGCPTCGLEYPIERGIAIFGEGRTSGPVHPREPDAEADGDAAVRTAAMLDLFEPGGTAVIAGEWIQAARALVEATRTSVLLLDPPVAVSLGAGLSGIRIGDVLPLAPGSLRGIALDGQWSTPSLIDSAARAIRPGGRLVAPARTALPAGVVERARDDRYWVGEVEATASTPVQLRPRPR